MNSLDKIIKKKLKIYFSLKEVSQIVGMHYNSCKNRVKILKKGKYKGTKECIKKVSKYYQIHYSVIEDFKPKKKDKRRKKDLSVYTNYTTINPEAKNKSRRIFDEFVTSIKMRLPEIEIEYGVEDDTEVRGKNMHIHIVSNVEDFQIKFADIIDVYFGKIQINEETPNNIFTVLAYIKKADINY